MSRLFSAVDTRGIRLRNRAVISPMAQYCAEKGCATDFHFAHLAAFATGGGGLVFTESTKVQPRGVGSFGDLCLWRAARAWRGCHRLLFWWMTSRSPTASQIQRAPGYQVPYAERIRRDANVLAMAVGLIVDPHQAEQILEHERADLIAIGREALFDPYWPLHASRALDDNPSFSLWPRQWAWWLQRRNSAGFGRQVPQRLNNTTNSFHGQHPASSSRDELAFS